MWTIQFVCRSIPSETHLNFCRNPIRKNQPLDDKKTPTYLWAQTTIRSYKISKLARAVGVPGILQYTRQCVQVSISAGPNGTQWNTQWFLPRKCSKSDMVGTSISVISVTQMGSTEKKHQKPQESCTRCPPASMGVTMAGLPHCIYTYIYIYVAWW